MLRVKKRSPHNDGARKRKKARLLREENRLKQESGAKVKTPAIKACDTTSTIHHDTVIEVFDYNAESFEEYRYEKDTLGGFDNLPALSKNKIRWINVDDVMDLESIEHICNGFNVHQLVMESILDCTQRPRIEEYDDYIFMIAKMSYFDADEMVYEQLCLILGEGFLITFGEREGDVFNTIREKIKRDNTNIRRKGADYLTYLILDGIVDGYFKVLERLGEQIDEEEELFLDDPTIEGLHELRNLKKELLYVHKSIWPLREVVSWVERNECKIIEQSNRFYFREIYEHVMQSIDTTETYRELLSGLMDIYLSSISNKMNGIMKVLTIISTIFIPLTFIVGLYGMNFKYMPELGWRWGYGGVLIFMVLVAIGMIFFFKHKKWF